MMLPRCTLMSAIAALLIGMAFMSSPASAQVQVPTPTPRPQITPNPKAVLPVPNAVAASAKADVGDIPGAGEYPNGRVIVLRGLANIFSRGMDAIAKDLKERGVNVVLHNHSRWQSLSAKLIEEFRANPKDTVPIILIGHSLGGDASIVMANWLAQNRVPVRLIVVFDAVAQVHPVNAGVEEVINFYKPKGYGQEVKGSASFKGVVNNVDLTDRKDIDHLNIDKDPVIQQEVIASVMKLIAAANGVKPARKAAPVASQPPPAPPAETPAETTAAVEASPPAQQAATEPVAVPVSVEAEAEAAD